MYSAASFGPRVERKSPSLVQFLPSMPRHERRGSPASGSTPRKCGLTWSGRASSSMNLSARGWMLGRYTCQRREEGNSTAGALDLREVCDLGRRRRRNHHGRACLTVGARLYVRGETHRRERDERQHGSSEAPTGWIEAPRGVVHTSAGGGLSRSPLLIVFSKSFATEFCCKIQNLVPPVFYPAAAEGLAGGCAEFG